MKASELTGAALDWAVAKCEGVDDYIVNESFMTRWSDDEFEDGVDYHYSTDWAQGGPIIEREDTSIIRCDDEYQNFPDKWMAERGANSYCESTEHQSHDPMIQFSVWTDGSMFVKDGPFYGPTPLIAGMRCYVASKLGVEVEIPEELL